MTGPHEGTIVCPFPPCVARIRPVTHRTDPRDASKTALVIPIHEVEGQASWFGRCPASQFEVPELSAAAKRQIASSLRAYAAQLAERVLGHRWNPVGPWQQHQTDLSGEDVPEGKPRPAVEPDAYFPPRPAEGGDMIGVTNVQGSSDREALRARVLRAAEAAGECAAQCSTITLALEQIDTAIEQLATEQQTAAAMMIAGVGASDSSPEAASNALAALSRLGELLIELREGAGLLRMRNEGAYRVSTRAGAEARRYLAGPI